MRNIPQNKKVIYDFGSNNGDDIPYYLLKSDLVVAVEANPLLCREIERRFSSDIAAGRLIVENCVLTADNAIGEVYFYLHKNNHVLSQFPTPQDTSSFEKVLLPSKSVSSVIELHGHPHYVKIDVEHFDEQILRALFLGGIRPAFLSAESHSIEIFSLLVSMGGYNSFKLVDGYSVPFKYKNHPIELKDRVETYSFPKHSAGPFGSDIYGEWMNADNFFKLLALEGLGWKDIHATNQHLPIDSKVVSLKPYVKAALARKLGELMPSAFRETLRSLRR